MTTRERHMLDESAVKETCRWKTGDRRCRLHPTAAGRCAWHHHWGRLVDSGVVGDGQEAEFCAWWEQFQPYGVYGDQHGPWWADLDVLWAALCGLGDVPALTDVLARELYSRRCDVRRYRAGLAVGETPWARVSGYPLPLWDEVEWKNKVDGSSLHTRQCG